MSSNKGENVCLDDRVQDCFGGYCCSCREAFYVGLGIFLTIVISPFLVSWTLLGFLLTRSSLWAVSIGWLIFTTFAIVAIALDPFEWGYIFGIGLALLVVTVIVLGYDWPVAYKLHRSLVLYALLIGAVVVGTLALTLDSQIAYSSSALAVLQLASTAITTHSTQTTETTETAKDGGIMINAEVASEADLMGVMNECTIVLGILVIAWIILCDQNVWLPATEEKLLDAETRVLRTMCSKRVHQLVVEGLGTLIVTNEELPNFEASALQLVDENEKEDEEAASSERWRRQTNGNKEVLVLVHGYASANAYWAPVLARLQERFQVYCVELIGWGRSDRVPWTAKTPDEAYALFRDSLERWRRVMGLEKFVLLGHSLGTHACAAYTIAHPHRVSHLIFASPAGVGLCPEGLRSKIVQSAWEYDFDPPSDSGMSTVSNNAFKKNFQISAFNEAFLSCFWESSLTPMDGIRWLGPFGHVAVASVLEKRALKTRGNSYLRKLNQDQIQALIDFTYQNQANPPSGERCLSTIFMWQAWARKPLILWLRGRGYRPRDRDRSACSETDNDEGDDSHSPTHLTHPAQPTHPAAASSSSSPSSPARHDAAERTKLLAGAPSPSRRDKEGPLLTLDCPVTMIYGSPGRPPENDWMNCKYGKDLCEQLVREGVDARLYQMKKVGARGMEVMGRYISYIYIFIYIHTCIYSSVGPCLPEVSFALVLVPSF